MRMLRPRQIQEIWGISVGSWRHAQRTLDLKPVALRFGGKPLYDEAVIVEKFGKPKIQEVSRKGAEAQRV